MWRNGTRKQTAREEDKRKEIEGEMEKWDKETDS